MRRSLLFAVAAVLALAACGTSDDIPALDDLTETYGCGHGFWIGNPDQTAALRFAYLEPDGRAVDAELPDPRWSAELLVGTDLYANWCDDVIEPDEPEPRVTARYEIVNGALHVLGEPPSEPFTPGALTLEAVAIAAQIGPDEVVPLGDVTIENHSYGLFAG